ncbi:hypothetical protein GJ744_007035 [Endocarpon pusillum]|uniref:1,3-beta-glucanosyltransferase n=1 Tax=Endocarpon pusillum TaxID=364733 RepID=A0A8H7AN52_9EURO|nr:hypothetical protein GJ744_007035 [Endocarpon pusillum]
MFFHATGQAGAGIAYQLVANDPLIDTKQCQLDVTLMKELGANAIRVYHVDPLADHTGCMQVFADAGIYLFVDMDSFQTYIKLDVIAWNQNKSDSFKQVMDEFQKYDNTAGFFVGNEVLNGLSDSPAAPYLLAAAADLKAYRDAKGYRPIPIGYSATDSAPLGSLLQDYLACRSNVSERVDFFSLNSYEWCGSQTSYATSGYMALQHSFEDYPAPIFFSETGCNTVPPRDFSDQTAIFGANMSGTWSGAIIYEWIQEMNHYGLVSYGPYAPNALQQGTTIIDGYPRQGTPTPVTPDFSNLKAQWATISPTGVVLSAYSGTSVTPRPCPPSTAGGWAVDASLPLPTIGQVETPAASSAASAPSPTGPTGPRPAGPATSSSAADTVGSGSATSTTASGSAAQFEHNVLFFNEESVTGCLVALLTIGLAVLVLL